MKTQLLTIALAVIFCSTAYNSSAQIKVKKPINKPKIDLPVKPKEEQPTQTKTEVKTTTPPAAAEKPAIMEASMLDQVKTEQAAIEADNQMILWDMTTEEFGGTKTEMGKGFLSFVGDYTKPNETANSFTGKDFIYARLQIEKPINSYLPNPEDYDMEYYRVNIKATVNGSSSENSMKVPQKAFFNLGYDTNDLLIAVLPEKGFFESIAEGYKVDGKFPNATAEYDAYSDVISRNFSRQMAYLFKDLSVGQHKVNIEYEITAKLKGSDFKKLENLKGVFLLEVDEESKARFSEVFDMLTSLYKEYEDKQSIASQSLSEAAEEEMLANMTPREKERYLIAKRSPGGYMAAYEGEKPEIYFNFGELRSKNAYLDIVWPDGACDKCEAGTSTTMITKSNPRKVAIPMGSRVSINGKTLISSVSGSQNVTIYWFH